ncbi:iron transporter [Halalkalicoccus sp. NIPERK01]|uniref:iron transporter n=1 Tax=Halalkalicoccus sp. NIPERK01 TaxID=3053469 RepID=UPI00256EEF2A|nr:iron transporter [Halalkalicoccus sp. NIPERK01]MDL5360431.1 iron transporter [Halalkalicoccus sp. NIPERK01]
MQRRTALRSGLTLVCGASLSGCLGALESDSAWRDLVVDRPEEVYVPPEIHGMATWTSVNADGYDLTLLASRPHGFWTVTGTETNQVAMREAHSVHLMAAVREPTSGRYLPAEVRVSIPRDGESLDRTLWPMLSQRMGPHHGDNVALPGPGTHAATVRVLPSGVRHRDPSTRFDPGVHDVEFEYDPAAIEALERTVLDEDRRGEPGAVEPMGHGRGEHAGGGGHGEGHPAVPTAPPAEAFPSRLGTGHVCGCRVVVALDGNHLIASMRTPYNGFPTPFASLSARIDRAGSSETRPLFESFDPEIGHHYGAPVEFAGGERVTIAVETPPQVARHEGYETAFLDRGEFSLRLPR